MTPLITGGSLMGEITWSNTQSGHRPGPGSAPIASVESLSPTSSSDSPYSGVDIPIRVAITETLNAKFIGAGEENTKLATNAEIYIDFGVASIRFLNENHQLLLKVLFQLRVTLSITQSVDHWLDRISTRQSDFFNP